MGENMTSNDIAFNVLSGGFIVKNGHFPTKCSTLRNID